MTFSTEDSTRKNSGVLLSPSERSQPKACIQERERNARENDDDIIIRLLEAILRRIHCAEDCVAVNHRHHGHHQRKYNGEPHAVGDKLAHPALLVRTEPLSDRYGEARTDAHAEAQHKEVNRTGCAHARECFHTQKTPDNQRIYQIIELLKEHARQQRQGKTEDQSHR